MGDLLRDLRFAIRLLRKDAVFSLLALLSLALAIGLNTAIFVILDAIFLRPFPVTAPARLVSIVSLDPTDPRFLPNSYPNFCDLRDRATVFSGLTAFQAITVSLSAGGEPEEVIGQMVTGNYFDVLGVAPAAGRTFLHEEDLVPSARPVVVLSHALWTRKFGADPGVVGKTVLLNQHPFTVIGVAAKRFKGTGKRTSFQLWVPTMMYQQVFGFPEHLRDRDWRLLRIVGRLKPSATAGQAKVQLHTLARQLERDYPRQNQGQDLTLVPFMHEALGPNDRYLFVRAGLFLAVTVGMVLLCTCANVANLLLARSTVRRREMAIRFSLGASRRQLFRQVLTESALLALGAGALGLLIAVWSRHLLLAMKNPFFSESSLDLDLDRRVLLAALLLSALTSLCFGLLPAWRSSRLGPAEALKAGSAVRGSDLTRSLLARTITTLQVAFSFVSLVCAALFLISLYNARERDPGFEEKTLLMVTFNLKDLDYGASAGLAYYSRALQAVESLPAVRSAGLGENRLLAGIVMARSVLPVGSLPGAPQPLIPSNGVSPTYFATLGIPIVEGRGFRASDDEHGLPVAVINQEMARRFWPNTSAIGKRFRLDSGDATVLTVIGIVKDSQFLSLTQTSQPCLYLPLLQHYSQQATLYLRASGSPRAAMTSVSSALRKLERGLPLEATTAEEVIRRSLWAQTMATMLLGGFGLLALVLATIGLYSVASYSVNQRRSEIGIRMALGAKRADVVRLVVQQGMSITAFGIVVGGGALWWLGGSLAGLLYSVSPGDPRILGAISVVLALATLFANLLPARRASRVDPAEALRST